MKCKTQQQYNEMKRNFHIQDDYNPVYIFNTTPNELIAAIARGDVDAVLLAKNACAARGINDSGEWIGFNNAKSFFKIN